MERLQLSSPQPPGWCCHTHVHPSIGLGVATLSSIPLPILLNSRCQCHTPLSLNFPPLSHSATVRSHPHSQQHVLGETHHLHQTCFLTTYCLSLCHVQQQSLKCMSISAPCITSGKWMTCWNLLVESLLNSRDTGSTLPECCTTREQPLTWFSSE